jgi:hypothetical protein
VIEDDDEEDSIQGFILEEIYGSQAKLTYEEWTKAIIKSKKLGFLFSAAKLRQKIMEKAEVSFP